VGLLDIGAVAIKDRASAYSRGINDRPTPRHREVLPGGRVAGERLALSDGERLVLDLLECAIEKTDQRCVAFIGDRLRFFWCGTDALTTVRKDQRMLRGLPDDLHEQHTLFAKGCENVRHLCVSRTSDT
jgi:hypothetical protein